MITSLKKKKKFKKERKKGRKEEKNFFIESAEFDYRIYRLETKNVIAAPFKRDFLAAIIITYSSSHFFENFSYRISRKML